MQKSGLILILLSLCSCTANHSSSGTKTKSEDQLPAMRDPMSIDTGEIALVDTFGSNFAIVGPKVPSLYDKESEVMVTISTSVLEQADTTLLLKYAKGMIARYQALVDAITANNPELFFNLLSQDSAQQLEILYATILGGSNYKDLFARDVAAAHPLLVMDFFESALLTALSTRTYLEPPLYRDMLAAAHAMQLYGLFISPDPVGYVAGMNLQIKDLKAFQTALETKNFDGSFVLHGRMALFASWLLNKAKFEKSGTVPKGQITNSSGTLYCDYAAGPYRPVFLSNNQSVGLALARKGPAAAPHVPREGAEPEEVPEAKRRGTEVIPDPKAAIPPPPKRPKLMVSEENLEKILASRIMDYQNKISNTHAKPALITWIKYLFGNKSAVAKIRAWRDDKARLREEIKMLKDVRDDYRAGKSPYDWAPIYKNDDENEKSRKLYNNYLERQRSYDDLLRAWMAEHGQAAEATGFTLPQIPPQEKMLAQILSMSAHAESAASVLGSARDDMK